MEFSDSIVSPIIAVWALTIQEMCWGGVPLQLNPELFIVIELHVYLNKNTFIQSQI